MEIILTITHLLAEGKITVGKLWIVIETIQVLSSTFPADDRKWSAENVYRTFSSLNILSLFLFLFLEMNHVKKKKRNSRLFDIYSNSKFRWEVCSYDRVVNWKNNTDRHDSGMTKKQRRDKLANVTNGSVISHFDLEASSSPGYFSHFGRASAPWARKWL